MDLKTVQSLCHKASRENGWWDVKDILNGGKFFVVTKIALIHSEISEALEAYRKDKMSDHLLGVSALEEELADATIRIFDLAEYFGFDLDSTIQRKILFNKSRPDHQLSNRNAPGGKTF